MIKSFLEFQNLFKNKLITLQNKKLQDILNKFNFQYIDENIGDNYEIFQNSIISNIVIIDEYQEDNDQKYIFTCFNYKLVIFNGNHEKNLSILYSFLSRHGHTKKYFLKSNTNLKIKFDRIDADFRKEITELSKNLIIENPAYKILFSKFVDCLSAFLIKKSYNNSLLTFSDKIYDFADKKKQKEMVITTNDYIILRTIDQGSMSIIFLIYYMKEEKIFALKMPNEEFNSIELIERERNNYLNVKYPFMPHYFGYVEIRNVKCLLIEYIEGKTLNKYDLSQLNENEKNTIIFELMLIIRYFHSKKYIYRDIYFNNIIINENKDAILIDFDRLIEKDNQNTKNFIHENIPPEINDDKQLTYKSDTYSLAFVIYYILFGEKPVRKIPKKDEKIDIMYDLSKLQSNKKLIFEKCFKQNAEERPTIMELMNLFFGNYSYLYQLNEDKELLMFLFFDIDSIEMFYSIFSLIMNGQSNSYNVEALIQFLSKISDQNNSLAQFILGNFYYDEISPDINKAIHYFSLSANQNNSDAQFILGIIYYEGKYISRDINKAIHYLTLAANQDNSDAQFELGNIYFNVKYGSQDINKAIHYYSLAADQNNSNAQLKLGYIYSEGKYAPYNINKSIYYYSLSADQNNADAQYKLGVIYLSGKNISQDVDKAIYYFKLAANQNNSNAQFELGCIYYNGKYVSQDINKAIYYFTLAANQNNLSALNTLGFFYYDKKYVPQDINKSIYYFTLAANQNNSIALNQLGCFYLDGKYVTQDIEKAIYYFSLAAKQNHLDALLNLGNIYFYGQYVSKDMNKAIYYYALASDQNNIEAQYNLGIIYYFKLEKTDINKSIHYFTLAAKQNEPDAQFLLGMIYLENVYIPRDIGKAIFYLKLSANQNNSDAQYELGVIYYEGNYVKKNIFEAIHYFKLAADNNNSKALNNLGCIFCEGECVSQDINKAIHYLTLAANNNHKEAQYNLGFIYRSGKYIKQDMDKAINYYTLAADQNYINAQYMLGEIYKSKNIDKSIHYFQLASNQNDFVSQLELGLIYYSGKYITQDINKAIYYMKLAAIQNEPSALYFLGEIFYNGVYVQKNIQKAIRYFSLSAKQNSIGALFILGSIYYEGVDVEYDIQKAIHYFKEASCFNDQYSKNNLGIIYKTGKGVSANPYGCIVYFEEAIRLKNDPVAMFNLAHIYFYGEAGKIDIEKAIELLIKSALKDIIYSFEFLCLAVTKKFKSLNPLEIKTDFQKVDQKQGEFLTNEVIQNIKFNISFEPIYYKVLEKQLKDINLVYYGDRIENQTEKEKIEIKDKRPNINSLFYEGIGAALIK